MTINVSDLILNGSVDIPVYAQQNLMSVASCLEYSQALRNQIIGLGVLVIVLCLFLIVYARRK